MPSFNCGEFFTDPYYLESASVFDISRASGTYEAIFVQEFVITFSTGGRG